MNEKNRKINLQKYTNLINDWTLHIAMQSSICRIKMDKLLCPIAFLSYVIAFCPIKRFNGTIFANLNIEYSLKYFLKLKTAFFSAFIIYLAIKKIQFSYFYMG